MNTAERDAQAARLRATRRLSYRAITAEMGYGSVSRAYEAVQRAITSAPVESGAELRKVELDHLDELTARAWAVIGAEHLVVNGQGVVEWNGDTLTDDGPKLAAIRLLVTISESRRKLLGLDAEQKVSLSGGVRYELVGVDPALITGETPDVDQPAALPDGHGK